MTRYLVAWDGQHGQVLKTWPLSAETAEQIQHIMAEYGASSAAEDRQVSFMIAEAKQPGECSPAEKAQFKALVREGDQVDPATLDALVDDAPRLVFNRTDEGELVGTAAIKQPYPGHRRNVFRDAGSQEKPGSCLELGYVHVKDGYRGHKRSRPCWAPLVLIA